MAVNQPPMFIEDGCYTADDFRGLAGAGGHAQEGIIRGLLPSVANLSVTIAPGEAVVAAEDGSGSYMVKVGSPTTVTVGAGPGSGGSRVDRIVARVQSIAAGDVVDVASIEVVAGTAGGGPPAVPLRAVTIALVTVPQGAVSITRSNVVAEPNLSFIGHLPVFASTGARDAAIPDPVTGQRCVIGNDLYVRYSNGWQVPQTFLHTATLSTTNGSLTTTGKLVTGSLSIPVRPYQRVVDVDSAMLMSLSAGASLDYWIVVNSVNTKRERSAVVASVTRRCTHQFLVEAHNSATVGVRIAAGSGTINFSYVGAGDLNWLSAIESPTKF